MRLFIEVEDETKMHTFDGDGREMLSTKWIETTEANIGSMKNPNKKIFGFKFVPIEYEGDVTKGDPFKRFFEGLGK